ncbi:hypothetical protein CP552_06785 [Sphingomonas melonis]|nr:hypothetical protein CP552_06785 [Sphingomonas melonis]
MRCADRVVIGVQHALAATHFRRPAHFVTPDLVRGPLGRGGAFAPPAFPLAAEWTPDQVRGDGGGGAAAAIPSPSPILPIAPDLHRLGFASRRASR